MDEAGLCDRIALIQNGEILKTDTPQKIIDDYQRNLFGISGGDIHGLLTALRKFPNSRSAYSFGQEIHFSDKDNLTDIEELEKYLKEEGFKDSRIRIINAGIEDCFMELMD